MRSIFEQDLSVSNLLKRIWTSSNLVALSTTHSTHMPVNGKRSCGSLDECSYHAVAACPRTSMRENGYPALDPFEAQKHLANDTVWPTIYPSDEKWQDCKASTRLTFPDPRLPRGGLRYKFYGRGGYSSYVPLFKASLARRNMPKALRCQGFDAQ